METSSDFDPRIELGGNLSIKRLSSSEHQGRFGVLSNTLPVNLFDGTSVELYSRYLCLPIFPVPIPFFLHSSFLSHT
jgi:hypothetical protein